MLNIKRYALALGTTATAIAIGFTMQSGMLAPPQTHTAKSQAPAELHVDLSDIRDTSSVSIDAKAPITPRAQGAFKRVKAPEPVCDVVMTATPMAAALVQLDLHAPCFTNERFTMHHSGLRFTEVTDAEGKAQITLPALSEHAVFIAAFANGDGGVAQARIQNLADYARTALQWKGDVGLELHALEFDADYESDGHIWYSNPGSPEKTATGQGGLLIRLGDANSQEALMVDVYSFPVMQSQQGGDIALSVEAEVTADNCGRDITAQTIELSGLAEPSVHDLNLVMPDCDAVGDFLVLKNLLQDLNIASN